MIGTNAWRLAAKECIANAQSLHDEARLLAEHGYLSRAAALAIIGEEEFAKAIAYTLEAISPGSQNDLLKGLGQHVIKHMISIGAEAAEIETHDYRAAIAKESDSSVTANERLQILFRWLIQNNIGEIAADEKGAKEYFKRIRAEFTDILAGPDLKNAALYVDIGTAGEVLTPSRMEEQAESEILGLEWSLSTYSGLMQILERDGEWSVFAGVLIQIRG